MLEILNTENNNFVSLEKKPEELSDCRLHNHF